MISTDKMIKACGTRVLAPVSQNLNQSSAKCEPHHSLICCNQDIMKHEERYQSVLGILIMHGSGKIRAESKHIRSEAEAFFAEERSTSWMICKAGFHLLLGISVLSAVMSLAHLTF
jgi:hypothetical protein